MSEKRKDPKPGWRFVKLADVVENINDFFDRESDETVRYVAGEHIVEGDLNVRRWGMTSDDLVPPTFNRRFLAGDVLFHSRNIKKLAAPDFDGITGEKLFVLRSRNTSCLLQEFLPYLLQTQHFNNYVRERWAGSTNKFLNKTPLMAYEFPLPPMQEQRRLLVGFQVLEETIAALGDAFDAAITLEGARLEEALNLLPSNRLLPVEKLITSGPRNGVSPKVNADERGYPTLSISAVRDGRIVSDGNTKYAEVTEAQAVAFELKANDVLVVRGNGNKLLAGKCGIVDSPLPEGCFYPDLLIRLKFDECIVRPEFAALQWNSPSTHKRLISRAKSTNGIWKINGADIRQHTLKVPSIAVQDALLQDLKAIRQARKEIERRKCRTKALKLLALQKIA